MTAYDFVALTALAATSAGVTRACTCASVALAAWTPFPLALELDQFETVGTLREDAYVEPSFAEYHPQATRYDSAAAPIAPRYFPYNRCDLAQCRHCGRAYLRYTEGGGYFSEARIRALQAGLVVDAAL